MGEHDYLITDFVNEALELLEGYDEDLVRLENEPTNHELINSIFRSVHNIKGMCGFLNLSILESLSHAGEDLLDRFRHGEYKINTRHADLLLELGDSMRSVLNSVQNNGNEGTESFSTLLATLKNVFNNPPFPTEASTQIINNVQEISVSDTSLRVDISLLDYLMNLAGELVLARNQILQTTKNHSDQGFRAIVQRLNNITSELQECVMKTRVQPISALWDKLPRVVRDASHETLKEINFSTSGSETELDKAILEAIKDPIIHLIRNSIDHGIESPDKRAALGKPSRGNLSLKAFPDGGYVIIEIKDDGAGLNTAKIRDKAIANGLIDQKQADCMSEQQINRLIFAPGFSTADSITRVSGRGVGMDVVRANIEAIGGHVQIASEPNRGTLTRLKIPMTLSIIPTLLVSSNGDTFAIPEATVTELVQISDAPGGAKLIAAGNASFIRLRDQLLPLVHLDRYLNSDEPDTEKAGSQTAIILSVDGSRLALLVDEVHDIQEIVVKPLDRCLQSLDLYSGATILGDGRIVLIIDPSSILRHLEVEQPDDLGDFAPTLKCNNSNGASGDETSFLIVKTDGSEFAAIPLKYVKRLERIEKSKISQIENTLTIQYRGAVLPVVNLANVHYEEPGSSSVPIVVLSGDDLGEIGIKVAQVLDITSKESFDSKSVSQISQLKFGIIGDRTTHILDVKKLFSLVGALPKNEETPAISEKEIFL